MNQKAVSILKRLFLYLTIMKKKILTIGLISTLFFVFVAGCNSSKQAVSISDEEEQVFQEVEGDTIEISSDKTEYEIIIIEPGFNIWLQSIARPEGYYGQSYLENRNRIWVLNWNQRVLQPSSYSPELYQMQIDYQPNIDYGYEVNYKLYNYFVYFQRKYKQRLGSFVPRI